MPVKNFEQKHIDAEPQMEEMPFYQDPNFDEDNMRNKKLYLYHTIPGSDAATAGQYGVFWIAPFDCVVRKVQEAHQTAGTDGSAVGLNVEKLADGTAPDSGTELLESNIDLKATANEVQTATLKSRRTLQVNRGDRLALKDSGTLTGLDTITVMITVKYGP